MYMCVCVCSGAGESAGTGEGGWASENGENEEKRMPALRGELERVRRGTLSRTGSTMCYYFNITLFSLMDAREKANHRGG